MNEAQRWFAGGGVLNTALLPFLQQMWHQGTWEWKQGIVMSHPLPDLHYRQGDRCHTDTSLPLHGKETRKRVLKI